jgi:nitrogen fixation/metabolism regulation signal transduction histidine kinase
VAHAVTARRSLRGRLLLAFVAVAVPPVLVLALAVNVLLGRSFDATTRERLDQSLRAVRSDVERRRARAREAVAQVAAVDLPAEEAQDAREAGLASRVAGARDLQALEIVGSDGRILSSHHWPAGFGLADRDGTFAGDEAFRWETVAVGYGSEERLAATAQATSTWRGRLVVVRGGPFLDAAFCEALSKLAGVEVAIRDVRRKRWIASPGGRLASWDAPAFAAGGDGVARGDAPTEGGSDRWAALPLHADLWVVVATPQAALARIQGDVRRLGIALAAAVLVGALAAALLLSGRIARPVVALAGRARAMAAGEAPESVSPAGSDEIGDLSRAFTDLSAELEVSRERLLQAERVAAWREMARRLAHELKNPIFPIQLSIETLRRALAQDEQAGRFGELFRESSDTVLDELRALRGIIDEFSDFARMPQPRLAPTDAAEVIAHVTDLYRARAGGVTLETAIGDDLPRVSADREMLARALGNLVGNALDAMPEGGTLRVAAAAQDGGVAIEISDTGPGLTEEQRTRLFTPYYTTKKGGTGLGLAIVQGIVSDHGGRIRVESEPGRGTTFTLLLPALHTEGGRAIG